MGDVLFAIQPFGRLQSSQIVAKQGLHKRLILGHLLDDHNDNARDVQAITTLGGLEGLWLVHSIFSLGSILWRNAKPILPP